MKTIRIFNPACKPTACSGVSSERRILRIEHQRRSDETPLQRNFRSWAICLACVLIQALSPGAFAGEKKLIEFGWDEPDPEFMREHAAELERSPFDGCVFHIDAKKPGKGKSRFTWEAWGTRAYSQEELQGALDDLEAAKLRRFTHNFVRFNTTPAKLDWFDDYSAVVTNAELAAWFVRQSKCEGILFDIEQYEGQLFDFRKQKDAKAKGWEGYAAQVRQRGREVMEAFQKGCPDPIIFLTFGYILPWRESNAGKGPLANCHYGLLAPFLDGMLEAAKGHTRLIDGHESSYGYKEASRFTNAYQEMKSGLLPIVRDPAKYQRFFSFSFGLWVDHDWRKRGWNESDPSQNYFSPELFKASVRNALTLADEYVWIYSETPRWWSPEGKPVKLPAAYDAALRQARTGAKK